MKRTMLLVDDCADHRGKIKRIFEEEFLILECGTGEDVKDFLMGNTKVDVVYVWVEAKEYDGYRMLERFGSLHALKDAVVVAALSAYCPEKENKAFSLGAEEVVFEPINEEGLKYRIDLLVKRCINIRQEVENTVEALKNHVQYDDVTGLGNRAEFYRQARSFFMKNHDHECVVGVWNVDRFKVVNELYGSAKGDMVLAALGRKLRGLIGTNGYYARSEADKFLFCTSKDYLESILPQMEEALAGQGNWNPLDYTVQLHMGVYVVESPLMPVGNMCDRADMALNTIKGNYIERYAFYSEELRDAILSEQELVSEMDSALKTEQFVVLLQPIVDTVTKKTISAEALIRWVHPAKGVISPAVFIPIFEKNGFIAKLDLFVCEQVCKYQKARLESGEPVVPISVNISRVHFYKPDFVREILQMTKYYDIDHSLIKIEITEGAYEDKPKEMIEAIREYQHHDFKVMMDDFGSGYSSLNTLKDFNVDILKIDMKFISDLETSDRAGNILFSIFQMAKALRMETVAEGVETRAQYELLAGMGCDSIQGYLFSRPISQEEFRTRMLEEDRREFEEPHKKHQRTILVVDDHLVERELIKKMIGDHYNVMEAEDGEEALDILKRNFNAVSLVVADIQMPRMGGLELLKHMNSAMYLKKIPVIMVTAYGERENEEEALSRGALEIITKPYDARLVQKRIENILKISETEMKLKHLKELWERAGEPKENMGGIV